MVRREEELWERLLGFSQWWIDLAGLSSEIWFRRESTNQMWDITDYNGNKQKYSKTSADPVGRGS